MSEQDEQVWIPSRRVRFWAWFCLGVLLLAAWGGAAVFLLRLSTPVFWLFLLAIPAYLYGHWQVGLAIEAESGQSSLARQEHRRNLRLHGPPAVAQLLIRIYFPSSPLGGRNK